MSKSYMMYYKDKKFGRSYVDFSFSPETLAGGEWPARKVEFKTVEARFCAKGFFRWTGVPRKDIPKNKVIEVESVTIHMKWEE